MSEPMDLLQIKIEKARNELPPATREAIDAVDWKAAVLGMRTSKGYSFEQLGDLELETELVLCGLSKPEDYPKELETRMRITRAQAGALVEEMNMLVFSKIREELIKNSEQKEELVNKTKAQTEDQSKLEVPPELHKDDTRVLNDAGIKILSEEDKKKIAMNMPKFGMHPMLSQKLSSTIQTPTAKTEHTTANLAPATTTTDSKSKEDPYREPIE